VPLQSLKLFPAIVIVPTMQISWTLFSIISGMIYYQEYRGFTVLSSVMFCAGVMVRMSCHGRASWCACHGRVSWCACHGRHGAHVMSWAGVMAHARALQWN
jgi:hypothetical protein